MARGVIQLHRLTPAKRRRPDLAFSAHLEETDFTADGATEDDATNNLLQVIAAYSWPADRTSYDIRPPKERPYE